MSKKNRPVICILDMDKERCIREEKALEQAIADKKIDVTGCANFGPNHIARTGLEEEQLPAIDLDGVYFTHKGDEKELTYEKLCDFLDMLVRRGYVK
ncbi:hypothetical protein LJC48_02985 [Desulfovibrio sp. OttesenSCG-928-C06]|nr:hypothetical protein [Desulfovibrio sp. OttesenSCG-928-C06]